MWTRAKSGREWSRVGLTGPLVCAALIAGCAPDPTPRWILLDARDSTLHAPSGLAYRLGAGRHPFTVEGAGETRTLGVRLAASDWELDPEQGWRTNLGFPPLSMLRALGAPSLEGDGQSFAWVRADPRADLPERLEPETFRAQGRWIRLGLAPDRVPPDGLRLAFSLAALEDPDGVGGPSFSGRGTALLSGEARTWRVDVPPDSTLRFQLSFEPWGRKEAGQGTETVALEPLAFEVRWNGKRFHGIAGAESIGGHHSVALPAEGGTGELTLALEGGPATVFVLDPRITPSRVGRPGRRPWPESRPDLVVFLADTFRADAFGARVGDQSLTPILDALAERSVHFTSARSVGTFTLPAHASLFTGLLPRQAGITSSDSALPDGLETIAERLAAFGYRTGAITDSGYVSRAYGMHQGFATFDERHESLESTLARARSFLEADDGRPVFLFVHTYRIHSPYSVSEATRRRLGAELGIEDDYATTEEVLRQLAREAGVDIENLEELEVSAQATFLERPEVRPQVRRFQALYLGGIADLDRSFATFLEDLEQRELLEKGYLVFTSDHGEAFGDHGDIYHSGVVFDEQTRVPLLIHGGALRPRRVEENVSTVDLAPTLAGLAGLPVPDEWAARSLLAPLDERSDGRRVILSFHYGTAPGSTFAIVADDRKVIGFGSPEALQEGRLLGAFDLAQDPHELQDLQDRTTFAAELLERHRPALEEAMRPVSAPAAANLEGKLEELRALGYLGR